MIEVKRGQIIIIKNPKFPELEGIVETVEDDRLKVHYSKEFESYAWALSEGDELFVRVHTQFGIKTMKSMVICAPSSDNELVIENAEAMAIRQKREYVRTAVELRFFIKKGEKLIGALSKDISAGGIKFVPDEFIFDIGDKVEIKFQDDDFGKDLNIESVIINIAGANVIAKYTQINEFDRDKISKFCLTLLSQLG